MVWFDFIDSRKTLLFTNISYLLWIYGLHGNGASHRGCAVHPHAEVTLSRTSWSLDSRILSAAGIKIDRASSLQVPVEEISTAQQFFLLSYLQLLTFRLPLVCRLRRDAGWNIKPFLRPQREKVCYTILNISWFAGQDVFFYSLLYFFFYEFDLCYVTRCTIVKVRVKVEQFISYTE